MIYLGQNCSLTLELLYTSILIELLTMLPTLKIRSCNRIVLTFKDRKGNLKILFVTRGGEMGAA